MKRVLTPWQLGQLSEVPIGIEELRVMAKRINAFFDLGGGESHAMFMLRHKLSEYGTGEMRPATGEPWPCMIHRDSETESVQVVDPSEAELVELIRKVLEPGE